jgi:hypothetical protein
MKKVIFILSLLFSFAYAQDIVISKTDIDRAFGLPQGSKLFENSVFSVNDTLLIKTNKYITSRLSKFQGSLLSISIVNGVYVGRILKTDLYYYDLKPGSIVGMYTFVKLNASGVESSLQTVAARLLESRINNIAYGESGPSEFNYASQQDVEDQIYEESVHATEEQIKEGAKWADNLPTEQTFTATLWLNFTGAYVNSSMWNYGTPFYCAPVSFVNNQDSINYIVNRVKALYYPFAINVTADSLVWAASPFAQRARIIITPTSAWYAGVTAISYVGSFTWGDDTPAFVFYGPGRIQNLPQAAFSTAWVGGTTMGNYRQSKWDSTTCTLQQSGSNGYGTGEVSWAPIMGGTGWTRNVWTWANGPTPNGCTYLQDNLTVLRNNNGFGYRNGSAIPQNLLSQDSSRAVGAGELAVMQPNFIPVGNDSATFKIQITKLGTTTITAFPKSFGANNFNAGMKLECRLYNESGVMVAQSDTTVTNTLNGVISQAVPPGIYYLVVRKGELPQSIAPAFFISRGYGQYGFFSVTMD